MTEAEWQGEVTVDLYQAACWWLRQQRGNYRKLRLWACACCHRASELLTDPRSRRAVATAECWADEMATESDIQEVVRNSAEVAQVAYSFRYGDWEAFQPSEWAASAATLTLHANPSDFGQTAPIRAAIALSRTKSVERRAEDAVQFALLRDIFGNPFRPVTFSPEWRTDTALALARQTYESRDFSAMPILADALQDAGCDNKDILSHCRGDRPHVRGCWVCDLVLGKQ